MGAALSRQRGVSYATGEFVLDSDDEWSPNHCASLLEYFNKIRKQVWFSNYHVQHKSILKRNLPAQEKVCFKTMLQKTMIATPAAMGQTS